jgi:D-serine deaminase-like pyridoxal phosphate-dependent protein
MTGDPSGTACGSDHDEVWTYKGLLSLPAEGVAALDAGFMWPMAFLRRAALDNNAALMAEVCRRYGVQHAPHLKTVMSPQLARLQHEHGVWGFTVATPSQLRAARRWGWARLLLANETVDRSFLGWLHDELLADSAFELFLYVDSVAGAQAVGEHLSDFGPRVGVLLEVGHAGGRTGVRDLPMAIDVARTAGDLGLSLAGVAGWEGSLGGNRSPEVVAAVMAFLGTMREWAGVLDAEELLDRRRESFVVSCGGSALFDVVGTELARDWSLSRPVTPVLRGGSYLLHDHGYYADVSPHLQWRAELQPAIEVWAQVISCPEPELAILNAGRRDVSFDLGLPRPLSAIDPATRRSRPVQAEVTALNDQHAFLRLPAGHDLRVGDLVALGISHPCTTMDKWRLVPVLDSDDVVVGHIHTYF